jgi:hypothetical protein
LRKKKQEKEHEYGSNDRQIGLDQVQPDAEKKGDENQVPAVWGNRGVLQGRSASLSAWVDCLSAGALF